LKGLKNHQSAVQTREMAKKSSGAHAFRLVDLPYGNKAIGTKWVYMNKKDERGIVVRNKARLVAQGHIQEEWIDYDKVFAHMARIEAIMIFLAFASFMGFIVYQMDVKSAFLYGTIEEEGYVSQPPGFIDPQFLNKVYKVEKALYGLHQAHRAWYETLSTFLLQNRYRRGTIDKTLFIKKDKDEIMLVMLYVDDIIFGSTKKSLCDEFEALMHKRFQMSSTGELTFFLGLHVKKSKEGIFISQDKYVAEILKKFDFSSVKTACTLIETQNPLVKDKDAADVDVHLYRSMIVSLMYLIASKLDIMFAVCACSRFQCKKQTIVATSTTEVEYVAAANCCGQATLNKPTPQEEGLGSGLGRQETMGGAMAQIRSEGALIQSVNLPLSTSYTIGSGEDRMEHDIELTDHVPQTPNDLPLSSGHTLEEESIQTEEEELEVMDQDQIERDAEVALKIQAYLNENARIKRKRQEKAFKAALAEMYDEVQAQINVNHELAVRLTHEEQEKYTVEERKKRAACSSKKHKSPKKKKVNDQEYEDSDKEHRNCLKVVPDDDKAIDYETLDVKSLIVDCDSQVLGTNEVGDVHVYKLTRLDGSYRHFSTFSRMLEVLDRQDVLDLHKIIMERFLANDPEGYDLILWGDLKTLVESNKRYPLTKEILKKMLSSRLEAETEREYYSFKRKSFLNTFVYCNTPVLPTMEPKDSLIMGDEDLNIILEKESDDVTKSSVEDLLPIQSEFEDTSGSDSECDLPLCYVLSPINIPEGKSMTFSNPLFDSNDDFTSSDASHYPIRTDINPLFDEVLVDIESKASYDSNLDEPALLVTPFFDSNEHACFDPRGDVDEINAFDITLVFKDVYYDSDGYVLYLECFLSDDTTRNLPPEVFLGHDPRSLSDINDLKIMVKVFDLGIPEKIFSPTYVSLPFKDRHDLSLTYVFRIFLPYFTYLMDSPFLLFYGSEDTIFDPGILAFHFSSLEPVASHRSGTFICFNVYPNILNESPMEICSSIRFNLNITMILGESS
nr:copia protein [Tanacetum cinerariifolium]